MQQNISQDFQSCSLLSNHRIVSVTIMLLVSVFVLTSCTSSGKKTVLEESRTTEKKTEGFAGLPQGFLDSSTFQVVVSSLKTDSTQAELEATSVAKKKSFQLLQTYPRKSLSPQGRNELKQISESGKIVKRGSESGKKYFIYQIKRTGLKLFIESKLP